MTFLIVIIVLFFIKLLPQKFVYRTKASESSNDQISADQKRKQQPPLTDRLRQPDADEYQGASQYPNQAVHQPVHAGIEPQKGKKLQNLYDQRNLNEQQEEFSTGSNGNPCLSCT